ncbi:MAG: SPFH domain-containing protein [Oscillospiraceae bacterium]|jgi:regulator of protease activity HflC (stomatin/prohibitin superfamily)|nr:SPFH domain-containing protein [Oscillospiraceae bacterium]
MSQNPPPAKAERSAREEKLLSPPSGFLMLIISILLMCAALAAIIAMGVSIENASYPAEDGSPVAVPAYKYIVLVASILWLSLLGWIPMLGLKIIKPNEAAVYTLFGAYYGTIARPGYFFINPFCAAIVPPLPSAAPADKLSAAQIQTAARRKVSLKAITLDNPKQKINDRDGNPIDIGVVVIWRVVNATKAVFEVDNYREFISTQADAAIRHIARQYPYDISEEGDETSLRGSAVAVAEEMKKDLQSRVELAGIEVIETRISHLAYAQEIAAAMLQRQQAAALIDARQKIVEGAVSMVEMALHKLSEQQVVQLDEERKAAMVSNLLVVLCGSREAQPVVNSGSLY